MPAKFPQLQFKGNSVLVGVNSGGGDFNQFTSSLTNLGMQITASSAYYGLDEGYMPITQLPTVAESPLTMSGHPIYKPALSYQGTANNEAETTTFANVARQQFGVDGTGVTVGVLSDSVNQFNGGLTESTSTGNLPTSPGVNVLQDGPAGSTDEGRAMLENIYDIAPGAGLAFATADGGDLAFANNIKALANTAKANIIVDDIGYADEPFFQDGIIAQAVNTVTAQGVTYFSSAGNDSNHGYLSTFRTANGTVGSLGSGVFQNFDGTGATQTLQLPITVNVANTQHHLPVRPAVQHAAAGRLAQRGHLAGQLLRPRRRTARSRPRAPTTTPRPRSRSRSSTVPDTGSYTVVDPGGQGPEPQPRRVRPVRPAVRQRPDRLAAVRRGGRHLLSHHRSGITRRRPRSASARSPGGPPAPTWARPRYAPSRSARPARRSSSAIPTGRC